MIDYRAEFIKRGLYPLEDIKDRFHKIKCVDKVVLNAMIVSTRNL